MFIPKCFKITNLSEIHQFIHEYSFGVMVSDSLTATHLPFLLKPEEGSNGFLYSHCAKANPHWKEINNEEIVIIFNGPHSYISPNWYAKEPGVPTWNYSAVHVYGKVCLLNSNETLQTIDDIVMKYEPKLLEEQKILTYEYRDKLLNAIIGFKVEITKVEAQLKLGQQRTKADQKGVYNALKTSDKLSDQALAQYMEQVNLGTGK